MTFMHAPVTLNTPSTRRDVLQALSGEMLEEILLEDAEEIGTEVKVTLPTGPETSACSQLYDGML